MQPSIPALLQKAKNIITAILDKNRNVLSQPGFTVNVSALADFSVNLTVRWWIDTTETNIAASISEIQAEVKRAFNEHNINIPYPVQEVKVHRDQNLPYMNAETSGKQTP